MIMNLKMCTINKFFGKMCLKTIRGTFLQYVVCNQGRDRVRHEGKWEDRNFWWGMTSNGRVRFKILVWALCWSPIKTILRSVVGVNAVIIWKRVCVREYIFFQSNKVTACKVRDGKEVAKSLMVFNLRKIIHPLQNKKYLRT